MGPKPKVTASTQATGKRMSIPTAKAAASKENKHKNKDDDVRRNKSELRQFIDEAHLDRIQMFKPEVGR